MATRSQSSDVEWNLDNNGTESNRLKRVVGRRNFQCFVKSNGLSNGDHDKLATSEAIKVACIQPYGFVSGNIAANIKVALLPENKIQSKQKVIA